MAVAEPQRNRGKPKKRTGVRVPPKSECGPPEVDRDVSAGESMLVPKPDTEPSDHPNGKQGKSTMRALSVAKALAGPDYSPLNRLRKAARKGEGSYGGHVVGHTRSGKPIYQEHGADHPAYKGFTESDHGDAVEVHGHLHDFHRSAAGLASSKAGTRESPEKNSLRAIARTHYEQAKMHDDAGESHFNARHPDIKKPNSLLKAAHGEGARGGKVLGHTASGKPVYARRQAGSSSYHGFTAKDHQDAAMHHALGEFHAKEEMDTRGQDQEDLSDAEERSNHHYVLSQAHKRLGGGIMTTGSLPGPSLKKDDAGKNGHQSFPLRNLQKAANRGEGSHFRGYN